MHNFLTPEEADRRRKRNKVLLYCLVPIAVIAISALVTMLTNNI
ncbi:hypothetical protein [Bacillus timonensis]|nr:hypothetical protein [Bacillus timonensis]